MRPSESASPTTSARPTIVADRRAKTEASTSATRSGTDRERASKPATDKDSGNRRTGIPGPVGVDPIPTFVASEITRTGKSALPQSTLIPPKIMPMIAGTSARPLSFENGPRVGWIVLTLGLVSLGQRWRDQFADGRRLSFHTRLSGPGSTPDLIDPLSGLRAGNALCD